MKRVVGVWLWGVAVACSPSGGDSGTARAPESASGDTVVVQDIGGDEVSQLDTSESPDVATARRGGHRLPAVHEWTEADAAAGNAWFRGAWPAAGLIPEIALRHLYLTWDGSLLGKLGYLQDESGYWDAFRERYGFHQAPFDNDGRPLGLRRGEGGLIAVDCLACHAGTVDGTTVIGAANRRLRLEALYDDLTALPSAVEQLSRLPIPEPYASLLDSVPIPEELPTLPELHGRTGAPGATDAFGLAIALGQRVIANPAVNTRYGFQDPPAWWTLKYKTRAYWDGSATVGATQLMMATLLAYTSSPADWPSLRSDMALILPYLLSLEPPVVPVVPDSERVAEGAELYLAHCAECHGDTAFPNRVVDRFEVGTDPVRAERFGMTEATYVSDFTFGSQDDMEATGGYLAPPLVGIWASAPYFHNGSVPDLAGVLDPSERPAIWSSTGEWSPERGGLVWTSNPGSDTPYYDTSQEGLSNAGHLYGSELSATEQEALLAYLLTL